MKKISAHVLARFQPATRAWFSAAFAGPTRAQTSAWATIASGHHALVVAPTGSGKTLAAFLWSIDRLLGSSAPTSRPRGVRVLYVSPLKALAVDVERNLRAPLDGIRRAAQRLGQSVGDVSVGIRTGDTPADARRRLAKTPPDILITTPESLYLLLTSGARETLRTIETVIVDEVHALAGGKRGSHLALSLERLDLLLARPAQRIGLSATVRPLDAVGRFLGGTQPVTVVDAQEPPTLEVSVVVPVEDMVAALETPPPRPSAAAGRAAPPAGMWPHVEARVLELVQAHRSTIVFANSRRIAERLCGRLNDLAGTEIARAHHGSVSREQRAAIEDALKTGTLRAVVATSSLELGIDMGAVDLVVQIEAPPSVGSGLQRIGRAGHQVGAVSRGTVIPKYRGDLLTSAVVVERMHQGAIEALQPPRNPLDVLAQQIVAMVAMDDWRVDELEAIVRRAYPFAELPRAGLDAVLDMLAGRYPSAAFAALRPRLNWDRGTNQLTARPGARLVAVTAGGTIPDRGLYGVFLGTERGTRVGELDEEMVYESRVGEVFMLGASSWRIERITADRVIVSPAPGVPGKLPFWHGDALGRPVELGRALGTFVREVIDLPRGRRAARVRAAGCDANATANLVRYLDDQRAATGALPDDRTLVVERFRDAVGDWRLCVHSFFGARVHAPWAHALTARLRDRLGIEAQVIYSDDGIVVRVPDGDAVPTADALFLEPEETDDLVVAETGHSALFASRFRECAGRALLLPKHRAGRRAPLWQQRQKAASLLQVASQFASFPLILETYRECLQEVFDLAALKELLTAVRSHAVRVVEVDTVAPSPFACSLQLKYVSAFMYEGDAPLAERRAQALVLDRAVLAELMGREELRALLDAGAVGDVERELQHLTAERQARRPDDVHDLLRRLGDLSDTELSARVVDPATTGTWIDLLVRSHRAVPVRIAGEDRWIAAEDAARYRDALGVTLPSAVPAAFVEPVADPLGDLVLRYASSHGPFLAATLAHRFGIGLAVAHELLRRLAGSGRVVEGEFRPGGAGEEWIEVDVLRRIRRRSLAVLRRQVEPAAPDALARFAVAWHGVAAPRAGGLSGVRRVIEQLQGVPLPASVFEPQILRARLPDYTPAWLDALGAAGELVWVGAGGLGLNDGWIVLAPADLAGSLLPDPLDTALSPLAERVRDVLRSGGALFFRQIGERAGDPTDHDLLVALWELVWNGWATNDTLAPLRALVRRRPLRVGGRELPRRHPVSPARLGPPAGVGRWSLAPRREADATRRRYAWAEQLLQCHGVVTRGAVIADRIPGGFAGVYPVFQALEDRGRCRRGYFVEGLGGTQFALTGAVDRMRALLEPHRDTTAVVLAATDPATPYGAALPWPEATGPDAVHRGGRKVGALVVLVDGRLAVYVERGGRTLVSYVDDESLLRKAAAALAVAAPAMLGRFELERVNGTAAHEAAAAHTALGQALLSAGFRPTYRGLQLPA